MLSSASRPKNEESTQAVPFRRHNVKDKMQKAPFTVEIVKRDSRRSWRLLGLHCGDLVNRLVLLAIHDSELPDEKGGDVHAPEEL